LDYFFNSATILREFSAVHSHLAWFFRWLLPFVLTVSATPLTLAADSQWIEIKSPHFSVVTDAGEKP
jgi:hypothetical protein